MDLVYIEVAERLPDKEALDRFEASLAEPDPVGDRERRMAMVAAWGGEVVNTWPS